MKRWLGWMAATGVLLAACGGGESNGSGAQSVRGVTDTEIVLGTHTDLSGSIAILGVDGANGTRMRFDEVNEAGGIHGRKIRWIVEDSQYQVPKAIQAANKLINRDQVFAIVLSIGTPTNNAVLTQQMEAGVPNVFPITGARSMVEPFHRLQFHARGIYYDEIRAAVKYFVEQQGKTTPCVVYQDTDYGQETYEGALDQASDMGLELAAVSAHRPTESEFTAAILRLRNAGCDLVLMGTVVRDTILVLETARKMGWEGVAWVGNNAAYNQAVADQESGAGEGYYAFVHMGMVYRDDPPSQEVADWWDRYVEKFGRNPEYIAFETYRNADIIALALERAGRDLTVDKFIEALESIDDYQDIFGYKVSFGPDKHKGVTESTLSQVQDGRWRTLAESVSY
ncbi:MAG: ABC transporter substrate-binding protein [Gammaproteobacteria bacterium]|nr:ABC transporter substrate-binding protein [Gammaproteobacteria bacterium]